MTNCRLLVREGHETSFALRFQQTGNRCHLRLLSVLTTRHCGVELLREPFSNFAPPSHFLQMDTLLPTEVLKRVRLPTFVLNLFVLFQIFDLSSSSDLSVSISNVCRRFRDIVQHYQLDR